MSVIANLYEEVKRVKYLVVVCVVYVFSVIACAKLGVNTIFSGGILGFNWNFNIKKENNPIADLENLDEESVD
jgi:hypothetical protein